MIRWARNPNEERGVICGCDQRQEWLLPWWWERYSFYNSYPVLFCDFGMSKEAKLWCQKHGEVVSVALDESFIKSRQDISSELESAWSRGNFNWGARSAWFKKPFAFLESPYKISIWLDLDCEVLCHLGNLFEYCSTNMPLAMRAEDKITERAVPCSTIYNGGVTVFQHGIDILLEQARLTLSSNQDFSADDVILSFLIEKTKTPIFSLPKEWNWDAFHGVNFFANIFHWKQQTKELIKTLGGIKPSRDEFLGFRGR